MLRNDDAESENNLHIRPYLRVFEYKGVVDAIASTCWSRRVFGGHGLW